jgi:hypothetical protein
MAIKQLKDSKNIASKKLNDWGKPKTIGEPLCHLRGLQMIETVRKAYLCYNLK